MTGCSASKLILPVALLILIQCHDLEAGKMVNLMQSILDTLKNIESLLKDENVVVENRPSINYEYVSGTKYNPDLVSKINENSSPNNTTDEITEKQTEEEQAENIFTSSKDKSKDPQLIKKSARRNSNTNQNTNQNINQNAHWPKLRSIMEVNDPRKKTKISNHSENEIDRKNEDIVKRLFDPSSEEIE